MRSFRECVKNGGLDRRFGALCGKIRRRGEDFRRLAERVKTSIALLILKPETG